MAAYLLLTLIAVLVTKAQAERRVRMTPIMLLLLGLPGVWSDSHSLRYYYTGVSYPQSGLSEFTLVGYVDDREIVNYNSNTRRYLPKVEWMKKLGNEYWELNTQIARGTEPVFQHNVQTLMSRFNQTGGLHIVQVMYGCEVRDDGSTEGYRQHGYDGRDFMYLDTQSWIYIPTMNEAQITTQRWNSPEEREGEIWKFYLEEECTDWLKTHINNGQADLERRVRPEVKVWGHQMSDGVTKLQCLAYGFYPQAVDVKWVKNDEYDVPTMEAKTVLPHPDGTYQLRVSVEVPTNEEDSYSCHVDHSSLEPDILKVKWEPDNGPSRTVKIGVITILAVLAVLAVLAAVIAGVIPYMKRKIGNKSANISSSSLKQSEEEMGHFLPAFKHTPLFCLLHYPK